MVDERAKAAETPTSAVSYEAGYRKVTNANIADAVNGVAKWLQERLARAKTMNS